MCIPSEARRSAPSVLYLPRLDQWFTGEGGAYYGGLREALLVALEGLPPSAAVLVLATYEVRFVCCVFLCICVRWVGPSVG